MYSFTSRLLAFALIAFAGVTFGNELGIIEIRNSILLSPTPSSLILPKNQSLAVGPSGTNVGKETMSPLAASISITTVSKELLEVITGVKEPRADLILNNFSFSSVTSERNYQLNFDLPEKGPISIKILDASLQELFKDKMCDFDRKYSKSMPLPEKDTYYISINFNDDWFVRKIVMD